MGDCLRYQDIEGVDIPIKIDCDGIGTRDSEWLDAEGYRVVRIGAGTKALDDREYPNRRSELWFTGAEKARDNAVDLSLLPDEVIDDMRRQALSVTWSLDNRGRRVVMPKDEMRALMGRSPDSMDAFNLCHAVSPGDPDAIPEVLYSRQSPLGRR